MAAMIQRIVSTLLALVFVALTFVFASFLVALLLAVGLIAGGVLWWRARRRVQADRRRVIEGEYRIIER